MVSSLPTARFFFLSQPHRRRRAVTDTRDQGPPLDDLTHRQEPFCEKEREKYFRLLSKRYIIASFKSRGVIYIYRRKKHMGRPAIFYIFIIIERCFYIFHFARRRRRRRHALEDHLQRRSKKSVVKIKLCAQFTQQWRGGGHDLGFLLLLLIYSRRCSSSAARSLCPSGILNGSIQRQFCCV